MTKKRKFVLWTRRAGSQDPWKLRRGRYADKTAANDAIVGLKKLDPRVSFLAVPDGVEPK